MNVFRLVRKSYLVFSLIFVFVLTSNVPLTAARGDRGGAKSHKHAKKSGQLKGKSGQIRGAAKGKKPGQLQNVPRNRAGTAIKPNRISSQKILVAPQSDDYDDDEYYQYDGEYYPSYHEMESAKQDAHYQQLLQGQ